MASVEAPAGVDVIVSPNTLDLDAGETGDFTVTFTTNESVVTGRWLFGALTWEGGASDVRSPIAVRALGIDTETELFLRCRSGALDVDNDGSVFDQVPDDPENSYEFLGDGTITTAFDEPSGWLCLMSSQAPGRISISTCMNASLVSDVFHLP